MKIIGKFKVNNKNRTIYEIKKNNRYKYYYRIGTKNGSKKIYIKKPKDYSRKYLKYKFNKGSKSKSFDVYLDKNPKDTINIKYKTVADVKSTIKKLERLFKTKKYSHKRIWQVGMIMHVRLRAMKNKYKQKILAKKYFDFLKKRTNEKGKNKEETFKLRKKLKFKF
jgi:hypothetical protein